MGAILYYLMYLFIQAGFLITQKLCQYEFVIRSGIISKRIL
jgi:hypothetical protein